MIDLKNPYNWVAILAVMLIGGFVLRQVGNRVSVVRQVNTAAGQAA